MYGQEVQNQPTQPTATIKTMKTYTIPFSYSINANIKVQADSLEDAISQVSLVSQVKDGYCKLIHGMSPVIEGLVDLDSIEIDEEKALDMNPKNTYVVTITRTQTQQVEVEAHSADEAEDAAIDLYDEGEVCDTSWEDQEVVSGDATLQE